MKIFFNLLTVALLLLSACNTSDITVESLRCDYLSNPIAIDTQKPQLSWRLSTEKQNKRQTAYQILVAASPDLLSENDADMWNSGIVESSNSTHIIYEGKPLTSRQKLYWKVRVWDENGKVSPWSETQTWQMGFLQSSDWSARWIALSEDEYPDSIMETPSPYFRKIFTIEENKHIKNAHIYICGLGFYKLYINGAELGHALAPALSNYDKRALKNLIYFYDDQSTQRCLYNTFDVTANIQSGKNTIAVLLGNGWYNQRDRTVEGWMWYATPRLIAQLEIEYDDGTTQTVNSDKTWKTSTGAILHNSIFTGEKYDARLDFAGWNINDFDDDLWQSAIEIAEPPTGQMQSQLAPFDDVVNILQPKFEKQINDSTRLYSLPETVSGWVQMTVQGKAGSKVRLRFVTEEERDYGQIDTYILSGKGREKWEPHFTWHAFRYFEIITNNATFDDSDLVVKVVNTNVERNGYFECSNELFNKIYKAYIRTQEDNFHGSISSDCPHRERLAYTGDGEVIVNSCLYNYDMTRFLHKWLNDIEDARNHRTGYVTHTAPFGGGGGGPAWGSAFVIIPWAYYSHYGDKSLLEQHYDGMKQWIDYLKTRTDERGIVVREEPNGWCLGDWCTPDKIELPEPLVNTAYFYHCTDLMSRIAAVLGRKDDVAIFKLKCEKIKNDYNAAFLNAETGHYWEGRQGSDVFALAFGMVPDGKRQQVLNALLQHLKDVDYHFDTGILATPLLLKVLSENGRADIAYRLMNQRTAPSFSYLLDDKNSTLWENWNGEDSRCHPMFGSVIAWFYEVLAGINIRSSEIEENHIVVKPHVVGDLNFCKASYRTLCGEIRSEWTKTENGETHFIINIPANMSATIYIPLANESSVVISEDGLSATAKNKDGYASFEIRSGRYRFSVK